MKQLSFTRLSEISIKTLLRKVEKEDFDLHLSETTVLAVIDGDIVKVEHKTDDNGENSYFLDKNEKEYHDLEFVYIIDAYIE